MKQSTPINLRSILVHLALAGTALFSVIPFIWLVCATFKSGADLFSYTFLPWSNLRNLTLANYQELFALRGFLFWLVNSLFLASAQTTLLVLFSSLGGFALAKYRFCGRKVLMTMMLITLMLPGQVMLPGAYEVMYYLGWLNTYAAILVPGMVSVLGMFLFRQAMAGVPDELLQAARIDGCGELRIWWDVALPCVRPMVGAFTLMSFIGCWNSYLWPQIVLQDEPLYTLPIGLANMTSLPEFQARYGVLMAGTLIGILPVALLFFVLQKDFVAGLTTGAVKG